MHTEIETNGFVINLNYSAKSINRIEREGGGEGGDWNREAGERKIENLVFKCEVKNVSEMRIHSESSFE